MKLRILLFAILVPLTFCSDENSTSRNSMKTQDKFLTEFIVDRSILLFKRKLFLYRNELYSPWTEWGNCMPKDCTELRYRHCLNDSYEEWIPNLFRTNSCPFEYIVESRRCLNETLCHKKVPSKTIRELANTCGIRTAIGEKKRAVSPKILGGREAKPHSWPWQVALYVRPFGNSTPGRGVVESPFCGATLISHQWLITAAHCLSELVTDRILPVGQVFNVEDEMETTIVTKIGDHNRGKNDGPQEVTRVIEMAIIHPDYQRGYSERGFDVALLKLDEPVEFGDRISSICLPDRHLNLPEGHKCYAAGWGATSPDPRPDPMSLGFMDFFASILPPSRPCGLGQSSSNRRCRTPKQPLKLLEVELPLVSLRQCRRTFTNLRQWVHVCAGAKGKDTCRGDSGGGLFCQNPKDGRWHIYGITSFGSVHGCGKYYGVYTCTRGISDWIYENVD
nr:Mastin [Hymenolepis microstoma]